MKEFIQFIQREGVFGLIVGVILGSSVTKFVNSFTENILNPLISYFTGIAGGFKDYVYISHYGGVSFKIGAFLYSIIDLLIILFIVYIVFIKSPLKKVIKVDKLKLK